MVSSCHNAAGVNRRWLVDGVYRLAGPLAMVSAHEAWCDTRTGISTRCNCIVSEYLDEIEALREKLRVAELQRDFVIQYLNPSDTSFKTMMDTFKKLPSDKKNKLINLAGSLANLAETNPKSEAGE